MRLQFSRVARRILHPMRYGIVTSSLLISIGAGLIVLVLPAQKALAATGIWVSANVVRVTTTGAAPSNTVKTVDYTVHTGSATGCPSPGSARLTVSSNTSGTLVTGITPSFSAGPCSQSEAVSITDPNGVKGAPTTPGGTGVAGGSGAATEENKTCEGNGGLAWFLCPVVRIMDGIIGKLDGAIISMLSVDRIYNDKGGSLKKVWGVMRNIALLMLIPAMLIMVIGTALDFGPFDPYTVKRALPRMVAATIFISLSWWICTFLIDLSDVVGAGVVNLITGISGAQGEISLSSLISGTDAGNIFGALSAGTVVAYGLGQVSMGIIFSLAVGAVMGLIVGYLSLVLRLLLILGLLIFAPIFALGWIFPGNDKLWKIWKTAFISLLVVFPIITGAIGIGRVGAYIISQM